MGKIKGWKKNTKKSWRRDNDSMIISYRYNDTGNPRKSSYSIIVGKDIATAQSIDNVGTKKEALERISHWMKAHPYGFEGELLKTYNPKDNEKQKDDFWGEPIYSYTSEQAIDDGFLMKNPKQNRFPECNIITTNLYYTIVKMAFNRSLKRVFEITPDELLGSLMLYAKDMYDKKKFKGDNDKDFFATPKTEEGLVVWFVRNEYGKLTAMLPEDY